MNVKHGQFNYIVKVIEAGMNVLLTGVAGTGKTTVIKQAAEHLGLQFSSYSMTKQTSVNALLGFKSINGTYIPSEFRKAYEEGHIFLLDELDAADANVLLCLNTLENGYISFPDGIIHGHENFRLCATANPQDSHSIYTGRSKLDFSTLDRFYAIELERDSNLELLLTSQQTVDVIEAARSILKSQGSSIQVTMRDAIRVQKLYELGLDESPIEKVVFNTDKNLRNTFRQKYKEIQEANEQVRKEEERRAREAAKTQIDAEIFDRFWEKIAKGK